MADKKSFEDFIADNPQLALMPEHSQRTEYRYYLNGEGAPKARN